MTGATTTGGTGTGATSTGGTVGGAVASVGDGAPAAHRGGLRAPLACGAAVGVLQAASPLAFPWLATATVHALGLVFIAAVYIGFAVADGRLHVLAVEITVTAAFVLLAAVAAGAVPASGWLLVAGLLGHGVKDAWQHRTGFVRGTRWWPPFCATVDVVAAGCIALTVAFPLVP